MSGPPDYPPDLFYGNKPLDLRFRVAKGGSRQYFCLNNETLHLDDKQFDDGTYVMGSLLSSFCTKHCVARRAGTPHMPCPAFGASYKVGVENKGLATVEPHAMVAFEKCAGVQALLDLTETKEERFLLLNYMQDKSGDEGTWRRDLIEKWNACWSRIPEGFGPGSRRAKFDQVMWWTMRFPALIPQVWLNWLHSASAEEQRRLDDNPSRVDFVAFWAGERHIIEIDGPSHYASYNETTRTYSVDEREYARNLKIARSLGIDEWKLTRIARIEIRDVMDSVFADLEAYKFLEILPFHHNRQYGEQWAIGDLDSVGVQPPVVYASDDIPF